MVARRAFAVVALIGATACGAGPSQAQVGEPAVAPVLTAPPAGLVVPVGHGPEGIAVDPATGLVAVALRGPNAIAVLDAAGKPLRTVEVAASARHLRFSDQPGLLLAPLERTGQLAEIDVRDGGIRDLVTLQRQPHDVVAVEGRAFVSNEFSDTLAVVETGRVPHELVAPAQPGGVAAAGGVVGVLGVRAHRLEVVDALGLTRLGGVAAGVGPTHVEGDAAGRFYVVDTLGGRVLAFETRPRLAPLATVPAPGRPFGIALDSGRQRLWVTETATNRLAEYDIAAGAPRLVATFATVRQPNSVAVDGRTGSVYVAGAADGRVQILTA